ncbi:unnamed protein product, partial [Symbiodinium microadriaticum]
MAGAAVSVLCCSLLRRDDRRRRMAKALRAANLTAEFLDAVDGRELRASATAVPIYGGFLAQLWFECPGEFFGKKEEVRIQGWDWSNDDWDQGSAQENLMSAATTTAALLLLLLLLLVVLLLLLPLLRLQLRMCCGCGYFYHDDGCCQYGDGDGDDRNDGGNGNGDDGDGDYCCQRLAPFYNRPMRWGEAYHQRDGPTLILEDDALPAARAGPLLAEEWDVCFLAPTELLGSDVEGLVSRVSTMCYGTNAYLCSQEGAARLLRATEGKDIIPVDELMPALALPTGHPRRVASKLLQTSIAVPQEVSLPIAAEASNARPVCGICGGRQAADHPPGEACIVVRGISTDPLLAAMRGKGFCTMPPLHPELPYQVSSEVDAIGAAVREGRAVQATEWLAPIHEARLRHDVKLPLTAAVVQLLNSVIQEYGWLFRALQLHLRIGYSYASCEFDEAFVGDTAKLIELGAIVAFPGEEEVTLRCAPRQPWHSDVDFDDGDRAEIIQAFVALQDISETHGPTQAKPDPDELERESLTLEAGALALMAGHAYHRGAGNMSAVPRRLLHFAFMTPGPPPVGFTYHLVNELVQSPVTLDQFPLAGCPSHAGKDDGVLEALPNWAGDAPRKWFLIAGAMDPPTGSGATSRVRNSGGCGQRSGKFLEGIELDFRHMTRAVGCDLYNRVHDMRLKLHEAKSRICDFFDECKKRECIPMLYYTGHGAAGSGNWCFEDGCLSFSDICELLPVGTEHLWILADCCFSGHWANQARHMYDKKVEVVAAVPYFMTALDTEHGGEFTMYITGNKRANDLKRPIVCSTRSRNDFPWPSLIRSYSYTQRLRGETSFGNRFVMAQHFHEDCCSMFFARIPGYDAGPGSAKWCTRSTYSSLRTWLEEDCWSKGLNVMHISCSGHRFGAYAAQGFGSRQQIFAGTYEHIKSCFENNKWNDGWSITSLCPGIEHDWVAVVTQCEGDYLYGDSKGSQSLRKASSRVELEGQIFEEWKEGKIVTNLAVANGTWILAAQASPRNQRYCLGPEDGSFPTIKKHFWDKGFAVTLLLKDPSDTRWLLFVALQLPATPEHQLHRQDSDPAHLLPPDLAGAVSRCERRCR